MSALPAEKIADQAVTPRTVLYEELVFYREKANLLGNKISEILKGETKSRGDLLFQLYKLMLENKKMLIEVASKLAPYEHAKLESIEVKSTVEHRYVIRVPESNKNTQEWFTTIGRETKTPITIEQKPQKMLAGDSLDVYTSNKADTPKASAIDEDLETTITNKIINKSRRSDEENDEFSSIFDLDKDETEQELNYFPKKPKNR